MYVYVSTGSVDSTTRRCSFRTTDPICDYIYYIAIEIDSTSNDQRQIVHVESAGTVCYWSCPFRVVAMFTFIDCFPLRWWHIALILLVGLLVLGIIILVIIKIIFMILVSGLF